MHKTTGWAVWVPLRVEAVFCQVCQEGLAYHQTPTQHTATCIQSKDKIFKMSTSYVITEKEQACQIGRRSRPHSTIGWAAALLIKATLP